MCSMLLVSWFFCPIYALYEEAGAIHPNDVGDNVLDVENLIKEPFKN